jgi:DNA polymerase elongation subunit (family B)
MGADTCEMASKSLAATVCARGAYLQKTAIRMITEEFGQEFGLRVIYGDTDSVMSFLEKSSGAEQSHEWLKRVSKFINEDSKLLGGHLKMASEDVCNILLMKKKNYAKYKHCVENGYLEDPEMKYSGIVNRSKTEHVIDATKELSESTLKYEKDPTQIYVDIIAAVAEGRVPRERLAHTKMLSKDLDSYANEAHAVAARQMKHDGMIVRVGDRIEYYTCLLLNSTKQKATSIVAEPFVSKYDLDYRAYAEETIKALANFEPCIKNYAKHSDIRSYKVKRGTYRDPPLQSVSARVGNKKRVAPVQTGPMSKFVTRTKKIRQSYDLDEMLGADDDDMDCDVSASAACEAVPEDSAAANTESEDEQDDLADL